MKKNTLLLIVAILVACFFASYADAQPNDKNFAYYEALNEISNSTAILNEITLAGFPTLFITDALIEANRTFERARLAEILRNPSSPLFSDLDRKKAQEVSKVVNLENVTYADVIKFTSLIKKHKDEMYTLIDSMSVVEMNLNSSKASEIGANDIDFSKQLSKLDEARKAFREDRFDDASKLLDSIKTDLESQTYANVMLQGVVESAKGTIMKYWMYILAALLILIVIIVFAIIATTKHITRKKIEKMKAEREAIVEMMKETQDERFRKDTISALVYNIRMKKYEEMLNKIKEELPVLEKYLKHNKR